MLSDKRKKTLKNFLTTEFLKQHSVGTSTLKTTKKKAIHTTI